SAASAVNVKPNGNKACIISSGLQAPIFAASARVTLGAKSLRRIGLRSVAKGGASRAIASILALLALMIADIFVSAFTCILNGFVLTGSKMLLRIPIDSKVFYKYSALFFATFLAYFGQLLFCLAS